MIHNYLVSPLNNTFNQLIRYLQRVNFFISMWNITEPGMCHALVCCRDIAGNKTDKNTYSHGTYTPEGWRSVKSLSCVWLFATLWTVAKPGFSVHGISKARILERSHSLLQRIFPTQGSNPSLLHWQDSLLSETLGKTSKMWDWQIRTYGVSDDDKSHETNKTRQKLGVQGYRRGQWKECGSLLVCLQKIFPWDQRGYVN